MKANEFRLGNFVYAFKTVWTIDNSDFANLEAIETYDFIPLTKEWLVRAGFKESGYFFMLSGFYHQTIAISITLEKTLFGDNEEYEIKHVKYVHQLQNLFFSLVGEELVFSTEP